MSSEHIKGNNINNNNNDISHEFEVQNNNDDVADVGECLKIKHVSTKAFN